MSSESSLSSNSSDSQVFQPAQQGQHESTTNSDTASLTSEEVLYSQSDDPGNIPHSQRTLALGISPSRASPNTDLSESPKTPSQWKRKYSSELDLAASIDRLAAQDLTVHLYIAFKLKQLGLSQRLKDQCGGSEGSVQDPTTFTWIPPKSWTRWPLPPFQVPREHMNVEPGALTRLPPPYLTKPEKLSQSLQDLLLAQILRRAKVLYHARAPSGSDESVDEEDPSRVQNFSRESSDTSAESSSVNDSLSTGPVTEGDYQELSLSDTVGSKAISIGGGAKPLRPIVMADDQQAMTMSSPQIQSIMVKLNKVLMSMHHARKSYSSVNAGGTPDDTDTEHTSKSRSMSAKQHISRSTKRRASLTVLDDSMFTEDESTHGSRPARKRRFSSRSERFRQRKRKLGLQDWSDVIGIASMSGVDQSVVQRTVSRCEDLFDEKLKYRILHKSDKTSESELRFATQQSQSGSAAEQRLGVVHLDVFLQPIKAKRSWRAQSVKRK